MRPTTSTPSRLRQRITSVLLTLSLIVGSITVTATPADAAGYVIGCFRSANGYGLWDMPVQLWMYYQNTWIVLANGKLGPNGCQYFTMTGAYQNYPVTMVVRHRIGTASFTGTTPFTAPAGSASYHLGTGLVVCSGC